MITRGFEKISQEQFDKDFKDLDIIKLEEIKLPKRATARSAGYDIFSPIEFTLKPNEETLIPTGFKAYMLKDEVLKIYPRSSLGFKYFTRLANTVGIGDSDYYNAEKNEGHYWVKLRNEGEKELNIEKGEAIAQAIFQKYLLSDGDDFTGEERVGGFGSTNNTK